MDVEDCSVEYFVPKQRGTAEASEASGGVVPWQQIIIAPVCVCVCVCGMHLYEENT